MSGLKKSIKIGEDLISEIFHENSKLRRISAINFPWKSNEELTGMQIGAYKSYSAMSKIKLHSSTMSIDNSIEKTILTRRSIREYSGKAIGFDKFTKLLRLSSGISGSVDLGNQIIHNLRSYPSAGALYPLEVYPAIFRVNNVKSGLYHYNVKDDALELLNQGNFENRISSYTYFPEIVKTSSVVLIITAMFNRTISKYGERGYRFALIEVGHLGQNISLIANALGLDSVAIGGFIDDDINDLIGIDGVNEAAVYLLVIGNPKNH